MLSSRLRRTASVVALCLGLAGTSLAAKSGPPADPAAAVVAAARTHLGEAYAWGGAGPKTWDCSGLVYALWRQLGGVATVPRVSRDQQAWAVPLPVEQVQPGDLVFFGQPVTHVGIVDARTGTAVRMIDAASSLKGVVERAVWTTGVVRYGRVPRPGMPPVAPWTVTVPPPAAVQAPLTLPALHQLLPSSRTALTAAVLARAALGVKDLGDGQFVAATWHRAGGRVLPTDKAALVAAASPVTFADARVGDLVSYGPPATHVGIYVGNGLMVDASRALGRVVLRPVWASPSLHLYRLG